MTAKLTLSIDPEVVGAAKRYAAAHDTSVSALVEAFLATVSREGPAEAEAPVLQRWQGALRDVADLVEASQHERRDALAKKYL